MLDLAARSVLLLAGLYLVALGVLSLVRPAIAARFLLSFASSGPAHYVELALRSIVGGAFVLSAPGMPFPGAFAVVGWILLVTTACLLAVPWKWHRRFALRAVPHAVRYLRLVAVASLALGGLVIVCASLRGNV